MKSGPRCAAALTSSAFTELPPRSLTTLSKVWLLVLRAYLIVAGGLVLVRFATLAMSG
jgi:hypothetical protein